MSKRVFLVHGWGGNPENNWFPWLRKKLEAEGFVVHAVVFPEPDTPHIETWVPALTKAIGTVDAETYLVGHSIGCQAVARYLESLPEGLRVGGAVFVAGWFKRLSNEDDSEEDIALGKEWLDAPMDFARVRTHLPKSVAIFSDDDSVVPLDNQDDFRDKLGSEIIIEHGKGHFSDDEGVTELPSARDAVLRLAMK